MKTILFAVTALVALGIVAYIVMAVMSQKMPDNLGLQDGVLRPCPESPNCLCSEAHTQGDNVHYTAPIQGDKVMWDKLQSVIQAQGGEVVTDNRDYKHYTFSTPIMHYVDDVELRFDEASNLIHIRSASRIGRKDFGVNQARIDKIKQAL
ncbi:MAG: DUF1499 domain-containing protein [Ghiorsea sp.]|nr:DUF1499 domain-containing protein [Ghiorsea sp.]